MTLLETVMDPLIFQQHKHSFGETWAESWINGMSNTELLELISEAIDQMKEQK